MTTEQTLQDELREWADIEKIASPSMLADCAYKAADRIDDFEKQVQALQVDLHSLQATKDAQYSILKTNFDDACKMLRDAQAENNVLQAEVEKLKEEKAEAFSRGYDAGHSQSDLDRDFS